MTIGCVLKGLKEKKLLKCDSSVLFCTLRGKMLNRTDSHPSLLTLNFGPMTDIKYIYSAITLLGFLIIVLSNCAVISAVALHRSLQEPMYIFISVLCLNGLYGSFAFFPNLFVNLISKTQTISYTGCITQVFCIHTYMGAELAILSVMAYDRYLCICNPLRYPTIMTLTMVQKLVVSAWLYIICLFTVHSALTIRLPLCDSFILKIYCDNWSVVRFLCIDTTVNNIYGFFITALVIVLLPVLIFISYIEIIIVCVQATKDFRAKSLQTCTPHLVIITNFVVNVLFEILLHRFSPTNLPYEVRTVMSLQFLVVPPILNPLIYGLKTKKIRVKMLKLLSPKSKITTEKWYMGVMNGFIL
ncbi:olfactory receptor 52D1-like [Hyla sarda]|uniref:olfactory receptor 52D1-like n=1 Tax=Hyla sarda TaxID=327740 RepID=UPI0024C33DEB|nr:olfactory receptor 52D1-like [Hyla sarda]